jgi:hypothetical protein
MSTSESTGTIKPQDARPSGKGVFESNRGEPGQFLVEKAFVGGQGRCMGFVETVTYRHGALVRA